MAITIAPSAIPNAKKNSFYNVVFVPSGGTGPYSWVLTSGALPSWLAFEQVPPLTANSRGLRIFGLVPATIVAASGVPLFTVTDSLAAVATVTTATGGTIVDGPDPDGWHNTEAQRSGATIYDQWRFGTLPLPAADLQQRMWPLTGPAQNS